MNNNKCLRYVESLKRGEDTKVMESEINDLIQQDIFEQLVLEDRLRMQRRYEQFWATVRRDEAAMDEWRKNYKS